MSRSLVRPLFPNAPLSYNKQYQDEIVRAFSIFLEQVQNPGDARNTTLTLTALQSGNDQGLETGALFEVEGFLKISQPYRPHVTGVGTTGTVGAIEVRTT